MNKEEWEVLIVDSTLHDDLYAELWISGEQWAEVFMVDGNPVIKFYPMQSGDSWSLRYEALQSMFHKVTDYVQMMRQCPLPRDE